MLILFYGDEEKMKKIIAVTALVSIIGLTGLYQASAYMGMRGEGCCNGPYSGMAAVTAQMDEATKAKFNAFFKDTQQLRKEIVMKSAEKRAHMRSEEPDAEKVGELAGELFDLRIAMHAKAEAAGLGEYIGMRGGCGKNGGRQFYHGRKGMMNNLTPAKN